MIRQSKTTIKELTAQYRSVLKRAFLAAALAVSVMGTAHATTTTDVTFAGDYATSIGTQNVASGTPSAYSFTYKGTNQDGTDTADIDSDTATGVDTDNFAYSLADGTSETLTSGNTYAATDYTADTVAGTAGYTHVVVANDYELDAATSVVDSSYSYANPQYDSTDPESQQYITLDSNGAARVLTENYATDATYTSGSTTITATTVATDLIGLYSYQPEGGHLYMLSSDGTGVKDITSDGQGVDLTNPSIDPDLLTALQGMLDAYATDSGATLTAATDALGDLQTLENANYTEALNAYNADDVVQQTLETNFATYTTANNAYAFATNADSEYQQKLNNFNADTEKFDAASSVYDSPIEETITTQANSAIDESIATGAIKNALDGKANAADVYTKTEAETIFYQKQEWVDNTLGIESAEENAVKTALTGTIAGEQTNFADAINTLDGAIVSETERATGVENSLNTRLTSAEGTIADHTTAIAANTEAISNEATARANADNALQTAINSEVTRATDAELAIRNDFASGDTLTLAKANAYTDERVNELEKDMSSGIASATALSAVSVPNVKKGQLAVSGGYGYYNSQSAFALGAAVGLTSKWSANVGAALSDRNATFRAGTSYLIDLF